MKFGAHCSTTGGVWKALERGRQIGAEVVQIFVKNNMQWLGQAYGSKEIDLFKARRGDFAAVFGHTGYLINVAAGPSENRDKSLRSLIQEVEFATSLELPFLVLHPGSHLGAGEEEGIKWAAKGLNEVFRATKDSKVRIALENTVGQGSYLGQKIEHLAAIYEGVENKERLALCIDTAHLFAAGFDIRKAEGWDGVVGLIDRLIGIDQIVAFHLNDSKTELGSRVDRHEHIGKGKIGSEGFRYLLKDARFARTPGCLETPKSEDMHEDLENLETLTSLVLDRG